MGRFGGIKGDAGGEYPGQIDLSMPLALVVRQIEVATSISIDDPEEFFEAVVNNVLDQPPEHRFTESIEVVEKHVNEEFGTLDAFEAVLPFDNEMAIQFLENLLEMVMDDVIEDSLHADNPSGHLILLSAFEFLNSCLEFTHDSEPTEDERKILASSFIAVYARIYRAWQIDSEESWVDLRPLANDLVWARSALLGEIAPNWKDYPDPSNTSMHQSVGMQRQVGAVVVYDTEDISVNRGAELAGLTQNDFLKVLKAAEVEIQYGPESAEELFSEDRSIDE